MNPDSPTAPDNYQRAWRAQSSHTRVTIDAALLLNEVQRNQQEFQLTILWRDIREIGVGLLTIPIWFFLGAMWSLPWSWYLTVLALVWIVGFIFIDRIRHQWWPCGPGGPLLESVQNSLAQIEHQIWLLRNIVWWYLLPPTVSILAFFAHVTWSRSEDWWGTVGPTLVVIGVYAVVYYINQMTVRWQLEPRRKELLTLLSSLQDETTSDVDPDQSPRDESDMVARQKTETVKSSAKLGRTLIFVVLLAALTAFASVVAHFAGRAAAGYPKLSPFAAVRWHESQPEVKLGDEWFKLVSLDEIPSSEIVAFSQRTYEDKWQKRFEEDLVELLARMGHPLQDTVTLVVQSLASGETRILKDVPMTSANRRAIRNAAQARQHSGQ